MPGLIAALIGMPNRSRPYGRGAVEVVVVAGLLGFTALFVLMALPRGREASRMAGCQRNLMQVGLGLQMYHQTNRLFPTIPKLGDPAGVGPIKSMLDDFSIPDLLEIRDPTNPPKPSRSPPKELRIPGLACPSDPNAMAGAYASVVSYRANTGDSPEGSGGPFQPGRAITSTEVEAADGLAFTAAFSERLIGDGKDGVPSLWDYASSTASVGQAGCPDSPAERWRGDAGSDWAEASWRSTLYSHVLRPNAGPSCIGEGGRTAVMGASSGHVKRINVLWMDGSLKVVTPSIEPRIWAGFGTVGTPTPR